MWKGVREPLRKGKRKRGRKDQDAGWVFVKEKDSESLGDN